MIRLNTDQMRKRLAESYDFIYSVESEKENAETNDKRAKDSQVGNG